MLSYFHLFFDLCLFRQPAENVPRSNTLLLLTGVTAIVTGALSGPRGEGFALTVLVPIAQYLMFALVIWIVLRMRGHRERWVQTMTAIYGAVTLLQLVTIPLSSWHARQILPDTQGITLTFPYIVMLVISLWALCVECSVLRQAMQIHLAVPILIFIGCQLLLSVIFISFIVPTSPLNDFHRGIYNNDQANLDCGAYNLMPQHLDNRAGIHRGCQLRPFEPTTGGADGGQNRGS